MKQSNENAGHRGLRVVALGGGTGLSSLLRGLKYNVVRRQDLTPTAKRPIADLAAIVTVTDDGGSSGRLRRENRILPPGDIRNCMVALASDEALLSHLFQYRFHAGRGLTGHNFGNLFLAALTHVTGDFTEAVRVSSKVLAIRGRIFPSTVANVTLEAVLESGKRVHGETSISASKAPIRRLQLNPRRVRPVPEAVEAIRHADLILLGPGSLYTSILPNLLIPEIANAIRRSKAARVYIANLMTNRKSVSPDVARRYRKEGAERVVVDLPLLKKQRVRVILDSLLEEHGVIRHDSKRLARLLVEEFLVLR